MNKIMVDFQPSNHYTQITQRFRRGVIVNDPLRPMPTVIATGKMPLVEFLDLSPIDEHDLMCDCLACNESFGDEQERLYNMEMERENKAARKRVNNYGPTL